MTSKIIAFIKSFAEGSYKTWEALMNSLCLLIFEPFLALWRYLKECWSSDSNLFFKVIGTCYYVSILPLLMVIETVDNGDLEARYNSTSLFTYVLIYSLIIWLSIGYALYNL